MDKIYKKYKKSGTYYRKLRKTREQYENALKKLFSKSSPELLRHSTELNEVDCGIEIPNRKDTTDNNDATNDLPPNVSGKDEIHVLREASSILSQDPTKFEGKSDSEEALRAWALQHNITHVALKDLLLLIKIQYNDINLPSDPRTLLETPQNTGKLCLPIDGGKYWHNGVKDCLRKWFGNLSEDISISININIDGLPIHKSSKHQLWPILCNVHEFSNLPALPVGIFIGKSKPADVNGFLTPFVDEIIPILKDGFVLNQHTITLKIRCFICDSPARAFVKGVANFNAKNGCLKCTINGEYSHISRTVVFPSLHCSLRTDELFRQKAYGNHHSSQDTPLLRIPGLDMIQDFVVADPLHLLELGVMKPDRDATGLDETPIDWMEGW
ncbi:uncharacterized protein LOC134206033 [Armigeres subalbatus]|uniref:uncharacterized protein LOC134206033 n=1 Tax=Armigeres subalbatus TaxID=124917 RepID=UPI002ED67E49